MDAPQKTKTENLPERKMQERVVGREERKNKPMKKSHLILSIITYLALAYSAHATDWSTLRITLTDNVNKSCELMGAPIMGCYWHSHNQIYLATQWQDTGKPIEQDAFQLLFWHEIGNFLFYGLDRQARLQVFQHPVFQSIEGEEGVDDFALWMTGHSVPQGEIDYFMKALR